MSEDGPDHEYLLAADRERVLDTAGPAAPPRSNGELVFQAPWESRVFGLTLALHEQGRFAWDEFREGLIAAIARSEARLGPDDAFHYYACWLEALQDLLAAKGLCAADALAERERVLAGRPPGHDHRRLTRLISGLGLLGWLSGLVGGLAAAVLVPAGSVASDLDACLDGQSLPRVARMTDSGGALVYVRALGQRDGVPTSFAPLTSTAGGLARALELAARPESVAAPRFALTPEELGTRLCAPIPLSQAEIDAEERVVVAAGLNYAAHAEEAGGGDVFLFPKPVAPTSAYGAVALPEGVTLLDYEVELGFVLLEEVDLTALPSREELLARAAFFVANDVSDREPIIRQKGFSGPGTGYVEGKGQATFMPLGPWLVRGSELFAGLEACGARGLGLRLAVDEGDGFVVRQQASTERMILDPSALLAHLADEVARAGPRTPMPMERAGRTRHDPMAIGEPPRLPAGSVVLTGTPDGVALQAPSVLPLALRGLLHLRSPFEQFVFEERARVATGEPGGYLVPGDRVRASVDGLGAQIFGIAAAGEAPPRDPCTP